jgi:adenylate cyclase
MPDDVTDAPFSPGAPAAGGRVDLAREAPFRLGQILVEPALRRVSGPAGEEILQPRVMQTLVALARADGQIVTRDQLLAACWGGVVVGEDAIDRVIGRVRKLGVGLAAGAFRLETIPRVGYRLAIEAGHAAAPQSRRRSPSVCVLPFLNMSDDPQQTYFSDGVTEDIITDLSKVSALFVVARTTAFGFRDQGQDVRGIASQLGVSHILEGSVRKAGGHVRITAQLIEGATGGHVWAERWDRELGGIFALQDEISEAVVQALKVKLLPEEKRAIEQRRTTSPQAYDLYLMARRYYVGSQEGEVWRLESIERLCRRAVELDPGYAEAWTLLAISQAALHYNYHRPGDGGLAALERAYDLAPDSAELHALRARHLAEAERLDEAFAAVEHALELDPDSWAANAQAAKLHYQQRRFREAIGYWEKAISLPDAWPGHSGMLMSSYRALGDEEGVRRSARLVADRAEQALSCDYVNVTSIGCGMGALAALGETERARDLMERALLIDPDNLRMRYNLACGLAAHFNDRDGAIALLGSVFEKMTQGDLRYAKADPDFDTIRDDPRFVAMLTAAEKRLAGQVAPPPRITW